MRALLVVAVVALCGCPGNGGGGTGGGSATGGGSTSAGGGSGTGGGTAGTGGSAGSGGGAAGGSGGGAAIDAGSIPLSQLCTEYIDAICDFYTRCGYTQTKAGCIQLTTQKFNPWFQMTCLQDEKAAIAAGRLAYDDRAAAACLYRVRNSTSCSSNQLMYPECQALLRGRVTDGGCAASYECDSSAYCDSTLGMCPGRCLPKKPAGADAGADRECQTGYYSYDGHCRLYALTGLSCAPLSGSSTPQQCRPGEATCVMGICQAPRMDGYPCAGDSDCAFPLRCNDMRCSLGSGVGQVCRYTAPTQACKLDLACANPFGPDGGTCAPFFGLDAGCYSPFECAGNTVCPGVAFGQGPDGGFQITQGRCSVPYLGAPCTSSFDCDYATAFCQADGGCGARRTRGSNGACTVEDQCTPLDSCVAGTCRRPSCVLP